MSNEYKELSIQYALISSQTLKEKFDATNKKLQEEKDKYLNNAAHRFGTAFRFAAKL